MVKITDADALDKMSKVEGEDWKSLQNDEQNRYTFLGVLSYLKTRKKWHKDSSIGTIYGRGGWNRYHVYGDGEIRFSKYHSTPTGTDEAVALGFETI